MDEEFHHSINVDSHRRKTVHVAQRHAVQARGKSSSFLDSELHCRGSESGSSSSSMQKMSEINYNEFERKTKIHARPYNIIPLDPDSASNQAISQILEIQAAIHALGDTRGLPWPEDHEQKPEEDILDWLKVTFGFQEDSVSNQREHIVLLLANVQMRQTTNPAQESSDQLDERAVDEIMKKLFENYTKWCKFLNRESNLRLPTVEEEVQQRKLLYIGLYLLIWGEAANLRFMPECLCYIFHNMAFEISAILSGNVVGKTIKSTYGGKKEAFLTEVITPVYQVIAQEAERSKTEKSKHSRWRNYDDLNEYFWTEKCFLLGWPMRGDADFFSSFLDHQTKDIVNQKSSCDGWTGKINFVEVRSFWHIFRSFSRMWIFFILCLQAMIIIAWNDDFPGHAFDIKVLKKFLAIFISASVLHMWKAFLDIILDWKARSSMSFHVKLRYTLKFISAAAWAFVLLITYGYTSKNPTGIGTTMKDTLGDEQSQSLIYILSVIIYVSPNILDTLLFLFPCLRHSLESSNYKIIKLMLWWLQPCLYVGREIHESSFSLFKYTSFWVLLIATKLAFSYHVEIEPLVRLTKDIMKDPIKTFQWHELSLQANNNVGVVIALWIPNIMVYFTDTQIWYIIFSTFFGGVYGACYRLGEIRSLGMLRSRFQSLPDSFNARLIPLEKRNTKVSRACLSIKIQEAVPRTDKMAAARFARTWNIIITSFREEDLISNRERDLLLVPYYVDPDLDLIQWPLFLIVNKIPALIDMVKDSNKNYCELKKRIQADYYMLCAIQECYALSKNIIKKIIIGHLERRVIENILSKIDDHVIKGTWVNEINISCVPILYSKFIDLIQLLMHNKQEERDQLVIIIQEMLEVTAMDILEKEQTSFLDPEQRELFRSHDNITLSDPKVQLLAQAGVVWFPLPESDAWSEMIKRLNLLLTVKESTINVPSNLEARRRLSFFSNSLFMNIPNAPQTQDVLSFSVLTPYYKEDVCYSLQGLEEPNEDGVSILLYLQRIYPDEWANFLERIGCEAEELCGNRIPEEELCLWASYRGQTLIRTVKGMMYYRKALEFQAFLDMADNEDLVEGCGVVALSSKDKRSMWAKCKAIADMKFTYVVSCQQYGTQKCSSDPRAQNILRMMKSYPSLRVAYIDEVEEPSNGAVTRMKKVYYSTLVKAASAEDSANHMENFDQVIYRIKLPGPAILGEGKPENQNHAIIFTRGEHLQAIDMNQEHYMEETLKMRNLLQEFLEKHDNDKYPSILGIREHIFTSSVSSLAWFMSNQESSFVTIAQRILAEPLKVRFHYGHPDIFDKIFHLTRGGISKASKIINLTEDIFAGFNSTLRGGNITHQEYMQVGKGRDASLNQISLFEAKIANGNGEQTLSRDVHRLGEQFDFFRMLSFYFTTVGFYFNTLITLLTVYAFLYGHLYVFGLAEASAFGREFIHSQPLQVALTSQSFMQLGYLMALPIMMEIGLERGLRAALVEFILMQLQLASVFFAFSVGTKSHHYGRILLHGGAEYRATGRGFGVFHAKFVENYMLYSRSHFVKAIELMALLMIYEIFAYTYRKPIANIFLILSMWFMVGTWLFAPFLFNPSGFEWQKLIDDWTDWKMWISNHGGIGVPLEKSWESWWEKEQEHLRYTGKYGIISEVVLALRFLMYHYVIVCHTTNHTKSMLVYGTTWLPFFGILLFAKVMSVGKRKFSSKPQSVLQLAKGLMFVTVVSILIILITILGITALDIVSCSLALIPAGWGLLLIAQACRPLVVDAGLWGSVKEMARVYEISMGFVLFAPVAFLARFPFVSKLQTRMLFNQTFRRGLRSTHVTGEQKK